MSKPVLVYKDPLLTFSRFVFRLSRPLRVQLLPPASVKTRNGLMSQSLTTLGAVKNARGYELQYKPADENGTQGEWINVPFQTSSRKIKVDGLVSGKVYMYRGRAMGGLTGHSDWSEETSHRAY